MHSTGAERRAPEMALTRTDFSIATALSEPAGISGEGIEQYSDAALRVRLLRLGSCDDVNVRAGQDVGLGKRQYNCQ
jgi:hypothetical protein